MVAGLAFLATAIATRFFETMLVRFTRRRKRHEFAWAVALGMFVIASAALATGASTGWDVGTFRVFYLFGAVLNVPWLALGTVELLAGEHVGKAVRPALIFFTGLATGVLLTTPTLRPVAAGAIPLGKEVFPLPPRLLAGTASGLGAIVVLLGAVWSALRYARQQTDQVAHRKLVITNVLIALGTLVLSGGGLLQGVVGHDEAFAITLCAGITVIYTGFAVGSRGTTAISAVTNTVSAKSPQV